jgi:hypothetical protein
VETEAMRNGLTTIRLWWMGDGRSGVRGPEVWVNPGLLWGFLMSCPRTPYDDLT